MIIGVSNGSLPGLDRLVVVHGLQQSCHPCVPCSCCALALAAGAASLPLAAAAGDAGSSTRVRVCVMSVFSV